MWSNFATTKKMKKMKICKNNVSPWKEIHNDVNLQILNPVLNMSQNYENSGKYINIFNCVSQFCDLKNFLSQAVQKNIICFFCIFCDVKSFRENNEDQIVAKMTGC